MAVFPVTYVELIIWLILLFIQTEQIQLLFLIRSVGCTFGILSGVDALAGERWLFFDSSGNITLKQFDDGLTPVLPAIMIFVSAVMLLYTTQIYRNYRASRDDLVQQQ